MRGNAGFSIIEMVMVMVMTAIIAIPLVVRIYEGARSSASGELQTKANYLAQDLMEEILEKRWDENTPAGGGTIPNGSKTAHTAFGPGEGGETRASFDDVDDYQGLSENPPKDITNTTISGFGEFTRAVQVVYVDTSDLNTAVTSSPRPDYKRIQVTVTWTINGGGSVQLVTLRGNF